MRARLCKNVIHTMSHSVRFRGPSGQFSLSLSDTDNYSSLLLLLAEKTGLAPDSIELTGGFPPSVISWEPNDLIAAKMANQAFTIRQRAASSAPAAPQPSSQGVAPPPAAAPRAAPPAAPAPSQAVDGIPLSDGSQLVRRIIPADNSCLFSSVSYVMERRKDKAAELRELIAGVVCSDPESYNEGFLGRANEEYTRWIMDPDHWGGGIELSILSQHYGREIAAFDIQNQRVDLFGEERGYSERSMVVYDGIHYDALSVAAFEGAPEELDETVFETGDASARLQEVMAAAWRLVKQLKEKRQYTDTANFTLRCGVCHLGLKGEKEAVEHAKTTGHANFSEYR